MVETGVFQPGARLELLDGEIVEMSPQKSSHATAVDLIEEALRSGDDSEPEPDVAMVKGNIRDYTDHHPCSAVLVVEVADTTLAYGRLNKAVAYARNAIPEYWILNLRDCCLEVHRRPSLGTCAKRTLLTVGETISPLAALELRVEIAALLP